MDYIIDYLCFFKKKIKDNIKNIFFFISFLILFFGVFSIKKYFNDKRDKKAILVLAEIFERYEALIRDGSVLPLDELFKDIEIGFEENKKSSVAPYFLIVESAILAIQGKEEESLKISEKVKNIIIPSSTISFLYKLSLAIYLLKSKSEDKKKLGEIFINECINEKENILHEASIFYYGLYRLYNKNLMEADEIWNLLIKNPNYKYSPYKNFIEKARNWEY